MYPVIIRPFSALTVGEYHRIVQAREAVFFLEQRISAPDADDADTRSTFMWMEDGGRVVAFLRVIPAGAVYPEASIGRVLVDARYRGRGLCRRLMKEALRLIGQSEGPQPVRISAQQHLAEFYASLGFETVSEVYLEAGIPHVKMLRR